MATRKKVKVKSFLLGNTPGAAAQTPSQPQMLDSVLNPGSAAAAAPAQAVDSSGGGSDLEGMINRMGGIEGIMSSIGRAQQVMGLFSRVAPMMKMFGSFLPGASTKSVRKGRSVRSQRTKKRMKK